MNRDGQSIDAGSAFPTTRRSMLEQLRSDAPEVRREAFGALVTGYWKPIYTYLRLRWRIEREDAEDLTQAFLGAAFEKEYFAAYDPQKARFRTFVRMCLDRFVQKERKAARALKRGGGVQTVSMDFATAEGDLRHLEPPDPEDVDELFRREFVRWLFERTVDELRARLTAQGKEIHFHLFERYDLDTAERVRYEDLAKAFALTVTQVTNYLAATRRTFRSIALEHLHAASGTDEEYRADARELFGVEI